MRLGGFVLFGNNVSTVRLAVESVASVCDEVVAIDSGSTDGSRAEVEAAGARVVSLPWQGYGVARMRALEELRGCDYAFFLDSDERLDSASRAALQAWRRGAVEAPAYRVALRDWVEVGARRFLYRSCDRVRLFRRSVARYAGGMIVHESLGLDGAFIDGVVVDHQFVSSVDFREYKERKYAFLWGVQAWAEGRRRKWPAAERLAHFLRDAFVRGAVARGGLFALKLAWRLARYSELKYRYLAEVGDGLHATARQAFLGGEWAELFRIADQVAAERA
jgi:(heptosyl)LPS beta-1,4-glucosyltransferase